MSYGLQAKKLEGGASLTECMQSFYAKKNALQTQ